MENAEDFSSFSRLFNPILKSDFHSSREGIERGYSYTISLDGWIFNSLFLTYLSSTVHYVRIHDIKLLLLIKS